MKTLTSGCVLHMIRAAVAENFGRDGQQILPPPRTKVGEIPFDSLNRLEFQLILERHFALELPDSFLLERKEVTLNSLAHEIHFMLPQV